jgi:hypothetical protein
MSVHLAYPLVVAKGRQGLWRLLLLLVVDLLVLATFVTGMTDADVPDWTRVVSTVVGVLALFLGGLTLVRLVGLANQGTTVGA